MLFYLLAIPHYIDPILYCLFIIFYFILLKYISTRNNLIFFNLVNLFYVMIYGFIFCILFILLLDIIGIIKLNYKILFFFSNPIHKISMFSVGTFITELSDGFSLEHLVLSIKNIFQNNYKLFPNKNFTIELGGVLFGIVDFFRFINLLLLSIIIVFIILSKSSKKNLSIIFILLFGIAILNLSFGVRDSLGYNLYLYPLFLILFFLTINQLNKKFIICSTLIALFTISCLEFYLLRNYYKIQFTRENRIYDLCKIENWKNSNNYIKKYNEYSFVPLTEDPYALITYYFSKMDNEFFVRYCGQLEKKPSWKTNFFNIKLAKEIH